MYTKSFEMIFDSGFSLTEIFQLKLSDGSAFRVVLQEQFLIEALYTDSQFYSKVGQQFCIVFDIVYSKTGTEAAAESLYHVVEKQEMNGGQSISVLGNGANIDWCFPNLILRIFTSTTRATAKTLTQAGHVAPKFWVLDIRT